jgi:DNA helicase-2/ATP-dependent DNA helicase PcrA
MSQPSHRQQAIYDRITRAIAAGQRFDIEVDSTAGSGKTHLAVTVAAQVIPPSWKSTYLAFNRDASKEINERLAKAGVTHIQSTTINSMGLRLYRANFGNCGVGDDKVDWILSKFMANESYDRDVVVRLVSLAKAFGIVPSFCREEAYGLTEDCPETWDNIIREFAIASDEPSGVPMEANVMVARRVLNFSIKFRRSIDFDDQIYLPVVLDMWDPQHDFVGVDEAQDLTLCQMELVRRITKWQGRGAEAVRTGSTLFVGDPFQSIYGFRGADTRAMDRIQEIFGCERMALDITYRCPLSVVREAQLIVGDAIQARPGAPEGTVATLDTPSSSLFTPGSLVVCRKTAPLVEFAYELIAARVPCTVVGRDIGAGLIRLVKGFKARDIGDLNEKLDAWEEKETAAALDSGKPQRADSIRDKARAVRTFTHRARTVGRVIHMIEELFSDDEPGSRVRLCTGHKAKGLEAPTVFVLDRHLCPSTWAVTADQIQQERNLEFVMVTRAKEELYFINSGTLVDQYAQGARTMAGA